MSDLVGSLVIGVLVLALMPAVAAMYSTTCGYVRADSASFGPEQVVS